ncbi:4-hydroxylaminobenzoate lyase, partial [Paraburkholderia sp. RL18-085-BIA-A]
MSQTRTSSSKDELIARCLPFLEEVKDMTTGSEVEQWLNDQYGTDSEFYQDLARLIRIGVEEEGWAANIEIAGWNYRRARLVEPSEKTFGFSITTVYMDSRGNDQANPEGSFRGDYH